MVGLIGAMQLEMDQLMESMEDRHETRIGSDCFYSGRLYGREAVLAVCGPGKVNAALCAERMMLHYPVEWWLNLGVAGSGQPGVGIGDMVIATAAVQHDMDTTGLGDPPGFISKIGLVELPCDAALREKLRQAAEKLGDVRVHEGLIATGDKFIHTAEARERIHRQFGALAVEMEGAAVAHACLTHGLPCGVLRSISDEANGKADIDYPTFARMAAAHTHRVIEILLKEMAS